MKLVDKPHLTPPEDSQFLVILRVNILTLKDNLSACGLVDTGNRMEQRRFSGT